MPAAAPRLDPQLLARLERLARKEVPYAEVRRLLVAHARELGVPPPELRARQASREGIAIGARVGSGRASGRTRGGGRLAPSQRTRRRTVKGGRKRLVTLCH